MPSLEVCGPFLSTPSARRATAAGPAAGRWAKISIHALREEGDQKQLADATGIRHFYPRPPRGGRRQLEFTRLAALQISIHALREEGDPPTKAGDRLARYFYPRPPRGGRPAGCSSAPAPADFYPRPPRGGRRFATTRIMTDEQFLSTPSARRATRSNLQTQLESGISIHALREEGDDSLSSPALQRSKFLSTPSARRATVVVRSCVLL